MTLDLDLDRLFRYEAWANRESLRSLIDMADRAPQQAVRVMAHIIGASHLWLARLKGTESTVAVWPTFSLSDMPPDLDALEAAWQQWLMSLDPTRLDELVSYVNSKGEPWKSPVRDILAHLFMHAAYHRGQIAMLIGRDGGTAAYTDYIHAVREQYV